MAKQIDVRPRYWRRAVVGILVLLAVTTALAGRSTPPEKKRPGSSRSDQSTTTVDLIEVLPTAPTPSVPPPGLSPVDYQAQLSTSADLVNAALGQIAAGTIHEELASAVANSAGIARTAAGQLATLVPPVGAAHAHEKLVATLSQFADALTVLDRAVQSKQLCAGSSVLASLSNLAEYEALRMAIAELAAIDTTQGFHWGEPLPSPVPMPDRSLANGQLILDESSPGEGWLEIDNGTEHDAVIILAQGQGVVMSVYASAANKTTMEGIGDGTYDLYWTAGTDWDTQLSSFTRDCQFRRFDEPAEYVTTVGEYEMEITGYSIGLQPRVGGNADTSQVDPDVFPR